MTARDWQRIRALNDAAQAEARRRVLDRRGIAARVRAGVRRRHARPLLSTGPLAPEQYLVQLEGRA